MFGSVIGVSRLEVVMKDHLFEKILNISRGTFEKIKRRRNNREARSVRKIFHFIHSHTRRNLRFVSNNNKSRSFSWAIANIFLKLVLSSRFSCSTLLISVIAIVHDTGYNAYFIHYLYRDCVNLYKKEKRRKKRKKYKCKINTKTFSNSLPLYKN